MATPYVLDRPIWHALTSRQAALAEGDARARRFLPDYSPFAAARDDSTESLAGLAALIVPGRSTILLQVGDSPVPPGTVALRRLIGVQMLATKLSPDAPAFEVTPLGDADAADMLALATLTEPGPFLARTHLLGGFVGVKEGGRLVAMAGERLKPDGFTEVSGVCTHPDRRGRGYAGVLMRIVAARILARGETPFLHAFASNTGAIALYETLGFAIRCEVQVTVLGRD